MSLALAPLRYLLAGLGNTALGLAVIFIAREFLSDPLANLAGYLIVVPVSFLSHRGFSFKDTGRRSSAFARYLPVVLVGYGVNYLALKHSLAAGANPYIAQTLAVACHVLVTYLLSRRFVFLSPGK